MTMLYECTLQRNCSMTPRQVAHAYAVLCTMSLAVALAFFLHGIWIVLAFSLLELACVGLALLLYARHALDRERIALTPSCLLVECVQADVRSQARLDPLWTRVLPPAAGAEGAGSGLPAGARHALITLESRGVRIQVGRFVNEATRRQVARELRHALRQVSVIR
ncbi:DUF2244 domain-containing protein [Massilia sp. LXY-6]|uniref:DUF2244 domain-containing protein n=1 Tax=Massilia sp. LXY-6 TaxID=3379823 RepID=UPI003EE0838E